METSHPGYGWLAVFSGFCVVFIVDGIHFSFGTLLVEIVEDFDQGRALTGAIVSISIAFTYILAPITSHIANVYGCRIIVITGAIISSTGLALSIFATNVYHLWATFGVLCGIGIGMMYSPAHVCVIHNFKERKTLASGIVACGSGAGTFAVNQMIKPLIDYYGWKGTVLLEAGLALQGVVVGLFLVRTREESNTSHSKPIGAVSNNLKSNSRFNTKYLMGEHSYNNEVIDESCTNNVVQPDEFGPKPDLHVRQEITDTNSINAYGESNAKKENVNFKETCKSLFDVSLLKDVRCVLILLSVFIMSLGYGIPFTFIPDQVIESGFTKQEAVWLTSSIGVAGFVSRIGFGILGDCRFVNRLNLLLAILCLNGILTALSPLMVNMVTKTIYCCLFGALVGGFITIHPVVLTDIFGDKMFAKSFGLAVTSFGVGVLAGTPIGGLIFGITGSYNITFIIAGFEFFLSGILYRLSKCFEGRKVEQEPKQSGCYTLQIKELPTSTEQNIETGSISSENKLASAVTSTNAL